MEVSLAMSFHGSMADNKHFGPNMNGRKDVPLGKQFRTYVLKNNTHLIDQHLLTKGELLDLLTHNQFGSAVNTKIRFIDDARVYEEKPELSFKNRTTNKDFELDLHLKVKDDTFNGVKFVTMKSKNAEPRQEAVLCGEVGDRLRVDGTIFPAV